MEKRKDYLKWGVILVSLILVITSISSFVVALEEDRPPRNTSEGIIYTPPYIPAPQEVVDKVNEQIISKVGEDYFAEHIKLVDAKKSGERYVPQNQTFEPTYLFYYNYTHDLKKEPDDIPYKVKHVFQLRVYSNGELMADGGRDPGPREPYQFLISESEARDIAIQNGLEEPQVELYYGNQGYNSDTPIGGVLMCG